LQAYSQADELAAKAGRGAGTTARSGWTLPGRAADRLSGAWTALVIGILALAVILVFILQNLQNVEVHFLVFRGSLPLAEGPQA
jgi:uncharacterized integral membrane protein